MDLNRFIKEKAREVGIELCGITNYRVDSSRIDWLEERASLGYRTEFEEADLDLRLDPSLSLENSRSIIVVAISYNSRRTGEAPFRYRGNLSKVSWGEDYHRVLEGLMDQLLIRLGESLDFNYQAYVDTGPLIDRELAYLAGLGYYGKNASIINESYGSFIAIGYIITDLDIGEDQPLEGQCGDCDLCLRACPTQALEGDYRVNPKRCISYLTQTKDIIEEDLREKMGSKLYGCDTCQLVCPKNKGLEETSHGEFRPGPNQGYLDIEELFQLSNREFKARYGPMAGSWRGKNILKRNGIIALANQGNKDSLARLETWKAQEESELVRPYIDWAIEKIRRGD